MVTQRSLDRNQELLFDFYSAPIVQWVAFMTQRPLYYQRSAPIVQW